jgi:ubiquinone/menaquinone biosynthesis C-methylase UbiE
MMEACGERTKGDGLMTKTASNEQLRNTWEAAAPGWAKWEDVFSAHLGGITDAMLDMAGVKAGSRVLDIASGAGNQTLRAAVRVGPAGQVVASDISATMLDNVRRRAEREGLGNVEHRQMAADSIDASLEPFDAAICRFGLMLFPFPANAIESVCGVLKSGGRLGVVVVSTPENNPALSRPMTILMAHAGKAPPASAQPGLFALGGQGVLDTLFRTCGLVNIKTQVMRAPIRMASADDALVMMQQAFGAYRAIVADLGEVERARAWSDVRDCLGRFQGENGYETDIEVVIGSGMKL